LLNSLGSAQTAFLRELEQSTAAAESTYPNLETFILATSADAETYRTAGPNELDTLRIVSRLFEEILTNPDVSLVCKALIARLQFPVLGLTIVDKSFFDQTDHPARQFVNSLAKASKGWPNSETLLDRHRLYRAAEILVQRINDDFPATEATFARALEKWTDLVARKNYHIEVSDRRINQAVVGQARLNAARRISERVINTASGRKLPPEVVYLIREGWFHVLVMICIKHGTDCQEWTEAKRTYEALIRLCEWEEADADGPAAQDRLDALIGDFSRGLGAAGRLTAETRDAVARAKRTMHTLLRSTDRETWQQFTAGWALFKPMQVTKEEGCDSSDLDHDLLQEMRPGTWVEVGSGPSRMRCRLVVMDDQTKSFVFANDDGLKVLERPAREVIAELESGHIRVLEDDPVVTRAMEDLKAKLRGTPV
jgi:hypothetical protein